MKKEEMKKKRLLGYTDYVFMMRFRKTEDQCTHNAQEEVARIAVYGVHNRSYQAGRNEVTTRCQANMLLKFWLNKVRVSTLKHTNIEGTPSGDSTRCL